MVRYGESTGRVRTVIRRWVGHTSTVTVAEGYSKMDDPVDAGGLELYVQELEHHIDEVEGAIEWCIQRQATVRFGKQTHLTMLGHSCVRPSLLDCVEELKSRGWK
jgi:hypothetical protein